MEFEMLKFKILCSIMFFISLSGKVFSDNVLYSENFEISEIESKNWQFKPKEFWSLDKSAGIEGTGSLKVVGNVKNNKAEAVLPLNLDLSKEQTLRISAWVKTEGVNYRRDAVLEILFKADGFEQKLSEYNRNTPYSYLEKVFKIPKGIKEASLHIKFYGSNGSAWIDEIKLESASYARLFPTAKSSNPYGNVPKNILNTNKWEAESPYRIIGQIDNNPSGDSPVWVDLDFSRLLLANDEREPVDPSSVKVFAVNGTDQKTECSVSFGDPISCLSDHYMRNGTLKWKSIKDIKSYEIYFSTSGKNGPVAKANGKIMGIGEVLTYQPGVRSLLWTGWAGGELEVLDVDKDGDWDIYVQSLDAGIWLIRNIGNNDHPLFLPRSRPLPSDLLPKEKENKFNIDWDGDGNQDIVSFGKRPRSTRYDNIRADVYVQFSENGKLLERVPVFDLYDRTIKFLNSSWFSLNTGDLNNDGREDMIVGTANSDLEIILNKGRKGKKPIGKLKKIPFNYFKDKPFESGDMSLKPYPIDWNGDGYTDIVCTGWQGFFWLFINEGKRNRLSFSSPIRFYQKGGTMVHNDTATPFAVDWDNDGDLDIISGGCSGNLMYFENTGTKENPVFAAGKYLTNNDGEPFFFNATESGGTVQGMEEQYWGYLSVVPRDVDHDGDLDLVVNDSLGKLRWIENIGTQEKPILLKKLNDFHFNGQPLTTPWRNRPGVEDWDSNGTWEFIVLNDSSNLVMYSQSSEDPSKLENLRYLKNTKGKKFNISRRTYPGGEGRLNIETGDWDGDGDIDLIFGEPRNYTGGGNLTIGINKGNNLLPVFEYERLEARNRYFVEWTGSDGHDAWHSTAPSLADFDGDGDLDILVGTESGRFTLYSHNYFTGDQFPVFKAESFEYKDDNMVCQVLDFNGLSNRAKGLNTQNIEIQILPEQLVPAGMNTEIKIVSPDAGKVLTGKIPFVVTINRSDIVKVDFFINGEMVASEATPPFVAFGDNNFWDTNTVSDGEYVLKAVATLYDGTQSGISEKFTIKNNQ